MEEKIRKKDVERVTILLNVYNEQYHIETFFNSLKKQTFQNFSILIIDDGSTDNTTKKIELYKQFFNMTILKRSHEGLRKARSYGVKQTDCDILIILDSDLILNPNAIKELIKPLKNNNEIAATGGILKNAEKGAITESYSELRKLFIKLRTKKEGYVDWINGGFCAIRKKIINDLGGYTQQETSEDLDISWRIRKKGYKLYLAKKAIALHHDPTTFKGIWKREYNTGKREYLLTKKHKSNALTGKRIIRFYPLLLPIIIIILIFISWILIPIIFLLSFIPLIILLKGKLLARITAWFTFNIMNFAYCIGFIKSLISKEKNNY